MWPSEDDVVDEYVLFQPVVAAVGDPFYKITSEALLVCQQLVIVIRPLGVYLLPVCSMFREYSLTSYKKNNVGVLHSLDSFGRSVTQCLHPLCRCSWSVWCSTSSTSATLFWKPSSLLDAQATVSPECISSTDLSASSLRPHL